MKSLLKTFCLLVLVLGLPSARAQAPVTFAGKPVWSDEGPGISGLGSRWLLRTSLEASELPLTMRLQDGWEAIDGQVKLSAAPEDVARRELLFAYWGWVERLYDGADTLIANGKVFTAATDVFGLELTNVSDTPQTWVLAGEGSRPTHLLQDGAPVTASAADGQWTVEFVLAAGARSVVLFAHDEVTDQAFTDAVEGLWEVEDWEAALAARWAPWYRLRGQLTGTEGNRTVEATAVLLHAITTVSGRQLPVRAKGRLPRVELESMGLMARALAQLGGPLGAAGAEGLLQAFHEAQSEKGRLPAWLGTPVDATATETRIPRFLSVWLSLAERMEDPVQGEAIRARALAMERDVLAFWTAERDRDEDAALECDGGREAGTPGSPRLDEVWSSNPDAPVGPVSERLALNCVEAGAWNHALAVEAARLATLLGEDPAPLRALASRRALEVEDPVHGHWDPEREGWYDYVRVGAGLERTPLATRTHVLWAPLTVGLSREVKKVQAVMDQLLEPSAFLWEQGTSSVAMDTIGAGFDPSIAWRGALQPEVGWSALLALSRYGYEDEAKALRVALMDRPLTSALDPSGRQTEPSDDAVAAAVHLLAATHTDQEEVLLFERGDSQAKVRSGHFQRVFHPTDGRLLLEVVPPEPMVRPRISMVSQTQLFSGEPMRIEVTDPVLMMDGRTVRVVLPTLESAKGTIHRQDGSTATFEARRDGDTPISWDAARGDILDLSEHTFVPAGPGSGALGCGCSGTGSAPTAWGALLLFLLGWRGTVRRLHRD